MKICFVGGGNIAQAIIVGLLKSKMPPEQIVCIERNQEKIDLLKGQKITMASFGCISENTFDLIVLAVKPKDAIAVAQKIEDLAPHSTILTVVAGIGISKYPTSASIIRSMPNTASAYNKGITAIYAEDQQTPAFKNACSLFERVGHIMVMEREDDIHSFTSIIGSGQAFLFQVLNVYLGELKAINNGNDEHAINIFKDFVSSLGDLFAKERDFEILINKIKSPGGTTQAGLESLESNKIDFIFQDAFRAAKERSIQISDEN
jgi:pyrroline-5-carboxylate reductase